MSSKEIRKLTRLARKAGWTVELRKSGHLRWTPPGGGRFITSSTTPRTENNLKPLRRELRAAGLDVSDI